MVRGVRVMGREVRESNGEGGERECDGEGVRERERE